MTRFRRIWSNLRDTLLYRKAKLQWLYWTFRYRKNVDEVYRRVAPAYDYIFNGQVSSKRYKDFFHLFLKHINFHGARVLDAGTGTGLLANSVAPMAQRVIGFDVSADQLRELRRKHKNNFDVLMATIEQIPLADQSCDVVITCGTMGMVAITYFDEERGIAEMSRILKVGGKIGVWVKFCLPQPRPLLQKFMTLFGWHLYDERSLQATFEHHGLRLTGSDEIQEHRVRHRGKVYFGEKVAHVNAQPCVAQKGAQTNGTAPTLAESVR